MQNDEFYRKHNALAFGYAFNSVFMRNEFCVRVS